MPPDAADNAADVPTMGLPLVQPPSSPDQSTSGTGEATAAHDAGAVHAAIAAQQPEPTAQDTPPEPAGYRGRRRNPAGTTLHRIGAGILVILALAAGAGISKLRPDMEQREQAFVVTADVGDTARLRNLEITVLDVRGGAKLAASRRTYETPGLWLIVTVRVKALTEPSSIGYVMLRTKDGKTFAQGERDGLSTLEKRSLQPGIPLEGELVFEVPKDAATDVTILLAEPFYDIRMDEVLEVAIRRDKATVDRWAGEDKAQTLATPKPVAP